jgi:hypothetical protein
MLSIDYSKNYPWSGRGGTLGLDSDRHKPISTSQPPRPHAARTISAPYGDRATPPQVLSSTKPPPSPKKLLISRHIRARILITNAGHIWSTREINKLGALRTNIRYCLKRFRAREQKGAFKLLRELDSIYGILQHGRRATSPNPGAIEERRPDKIYRPVLDPRETRSASSDVTWAPPRRRRP